MGKREKYGNLLLELEVVLEKMIDQHDVQRYDVLGAVDYWIRVHRPDAVETYLDGTIPELFRSPLDRNEKLVSNGKKKEKV